MILDKNLEFADATSVGTPNSTTVNVGNVADLGATSRDIGAGEPIYLVIQVTTAITSGGAATVRFHLSSDDAVSMAVDGSASTHYASDVIAKATLVAGYTIVAPLPAESPVYERYLGLQIEEVAGQVLTAGNVNAFLTLTPRRYRAYPDGVN